MSSMPVVSTRTSNPNNAGQAPALEYKLVWCVQKAKVLQDPGTDPQQEHVPGVLLSEGGECHLLKPPTLLLAAWGVSFLHYWASKSQLP